MRRIARHGVGVLLVISAAITGCELIAGLQDRTLAVDAAADVPFEAVTNSDFTLSVTPTSVVVDPGSGAASVTVNIVRNGGFTDSVNINLLNVPGVSGNTSIPSGSNTSSMNVFAAQGTAVGVFTAEVNAQNPAGTKTATVPLLVRVGKLLLVATASTAFPIPSDVTSFAIAVWGGGGAGGGTANNAISYVGGPGGAGGFAEATFVAVPNELLNLSVASGATAGSNSNVYGQGGGGGGYSAAFTGELDGGADAGDAGIAYLVVAGGGAGGGGGYYQANNNGGNGRAGGFGSGANGGAGTGFGAGGGATLDAGGVASQFCGSGNGSFLKGSGSNNGAAGGTPGGGNGNNNAAGGGGGGYFGGAAGANGNCYQGGGGGGGGSGHIDPSGTTQTASPGVGQTAPAQNHPHYVTGVGLGGNASAVGGPGLVIIYIP